MSTGTDVIGAAKLLSTPPSELEKPPAEVEKEGQEAQVKQEATPEAKQEQSETLEAKTDSDTKTEAVKHKVKVDGQELEVEYEELLKGYSRESHYQKKAKDLAQERETLTTKSEELDKRLSDAEVIISDKKAYLESEELKLLEQDDPAEYLREVRKIEADIEKFEGLKSQREQELQAQNEKIVAKERELLLEAFPEWSDEELMAKEAGELFKSLESIGFKEDELNGITDHRMFILARKAQKFDEIDSASIEQKEVKTKPKSVSPSAKQEAPDQHTSAQKDAKSKFKKTGSVRDAAALLSMN